MTDTYNLSEAKAHFDELVSRATAGEEVIIAEIGMPRLKVGLLDPVGTDKPMRIPGRLQGQIWIAPDAFSEELDAQIAAEFEASQIFPPAEK